MILSNLAEMYYLPIKDQSSLILFFKFLIKKIESMNFDLLPQFIPRLML